MTASVIALGGGTFTLTLFDQTQGWTQITDQTCRPPARLGRNHRPGPDDTNGALPLANFGIVNFTNVAVDTAPLGNADATGLTMVSAGGVTEASPSAITSGNTFSVAWNSNGTAASPAGPAARTSPAPATAAVVFPGHHHHHGGY